MKTDALPALIRTQLDTFGKLHVDSFPYQPSSVRLAIQRLRKTGLLIVSQGNGVYKLETPVTSFTESNTEAAV